MKQTEADILQQHYQRHYQNMNNNMNFNMNNNQQFQRQNMNNINNPQIQNQNMNNMNNLNNQQFPNQNMNNMLNPQIQNQNINNPQLQNQNIPKRQMMMIPQMPMMIMQRQPIMVMNGQRLIMSTPMIMLRAPNGVLMFNGNNLINNNNVPHQRRRNEDGFLEPEVGTKKMSMNDIEKLGIEIYDKTKHYSSSKCMICLEVFEDKCELRRLDCLHIFHKDCIDNWLKEHGNCPIDKILVDI